MNKIQLELLRLGLVLLTAVVFALITGIWFFTITTALLLYIGWIFYKIYQLELWMRGGFEVDKLPDSDGIWADLSNNILKLKIQAGKNKTRQKTLLKRFNNVISSLPDATLVLNSKSEIQWMNTDAARLLKLHRKKDLGQQLDNLLRAPVLHRALKRKSQRRLKINSPLDDDTTLMANISALKKNTRIMIVRDISQREQLEESRKYFAANASHELRTPLSVISGYLEILKLKEYTDHEVANMLESSYQQVLQMDKLLAELLTLSKLENRELSERKVTSVKLAKIIRDIYAHFKNSLVTGHEIIFDLEPELKISGSEKELCSMVENLVLNALKHTPAGTRVQVSWRLVKNLSTLCVEDNGPGIEQENIEHVTERFFREHKSDMTDGSGLGLAIVAHIAKRHGAELVISSEPGVSTRFSVTFPEYRLVQ